MFPSQPPPLSGVVHIDVRVDRCRWHVATAGDPEAPPIVLLHGWPQHWWCWRRVIPALAKEHRVYAPDLRGFGWSDAPPGRYDKEGLAADVLTLLDVLDIDTCTLVGHDWGGFVGWLTALHAPERLDRLVSLSIIHPWFVPERSIKSLASAFYQLPMATPGVTRLFQHQIGRLVRRAGAPGWSDEDVRLYGEQWRRSAHAAAASALYRTFLTRELPALTRGRYADRRVDLPVTTATGENDDVVTPARVQGAQASNLRTEVIEGAGHFLPEEKPREIAELILSA
ncbi:MAG: hypothetical protein QOI80_2157 [Solirubrobacteraceae bacterium]|nr:hypothetical protein [Solirubrobacteraceae bacterium]